MKKLIAFTAVFALLAVMTPLSYGQETTPAQSTKPQPPLTVKQVPPTPSDIKSKYKEEIQAAKESKPKLKGIPASQPSLGIGNSKALGKGNFKHGIKNEIQQMLADLKQVVGDNQKALDIIEAINAKLNSFPDDLKPIHQAKPTQNDIKPKLDKLKDDLKPIKPKLDKLKDENHTEQAITIKDKSSPSSYYYHKK